MADPAPPLGHETVEEIMARLIADAVAGLDIAAASYPDLIAGSLMSDLYGTVAIEVDRIYDRVHTELPAAVLPSTTFGAWLDAWATALGLVRKDAAPAGGSVSFSFTGAGTVPTGTIVATVSTSEEDEEVEFRTLADAVKVGSGPAVVAAAAEAVDAGAAGNVPPAAVTEIVSTVPAVVTGVTNPLGLTGGADVESDEALQDRLLRKLGGSGGPGNIADYENWALEEPGVGFVFVEAEWAGPGTVRVIITDPNNDPAAPAVVTALQNRLDPAVGYGIAPIGATVTVATVTAKAITVTSAITPEAGYSVTGAGGTQPLAADVEASLRRYIDALAPGEDVYVSKVLAAVVDVEGVRDAVVTAPAATVVVAALEVASLTTLNLS